MPFMLRSMLQQQLVQRNVQLPSPATTPSHIIQRRFTVPTSLFPPEPPFGPLPLLLADGIIWDMNNRIPVAATDFPSLRTFLLKTFYPGYEVYAQSGWEADFYAPPYSSINFPMVMSDLGTPDLLWVMVFAQWSMVRFAQNFLNSQPLSRLAVTALAGPLFQGNYASVAVNSPDNNLGSNTTVPVSYTLILPDPMAYPDNIHFSWKPI